MFITRQADYAVRCILFLSQEANRVVNAKEISNSMLVSRSFIAKILQRLAKVGIVRSTQGTSGGFALARKPGKINILDVIEAIQGPAAVNICAVNERACDLSTACPIHPVWVELREGIEKRLKKESFAKLATRREKLS